MERLPGQTLHTCGLYGGGYFQPFTLSWTRETEESRTRESYSLLFSCRVVLSCCQDAPHLHHPAKGAKPCSGRSFRVRMRGLKTRVKLKNQFFKASFVRKMEETKGIQSKSSTARFRILRRYMVTEDKTYPQHVSLYFILWWFYPHHLPKCWIIQYSSIKTVQRFILLRRIENSGIMFRTSRAAKEKPWDFLPEKKMRSHIIVIRARNETRKFVLF